ncbi:MAG: hypothetical protein IPJ66_09295 [Bacteroidetes bacterium]|nr:hypothetical protein [Bacteroidota bacterium]MBL0140156.1 hypothetical protein [Bacteroidota bacterium]
MNDPDSQARYSDSYNSFDKKLVDHIPKKLPNNQIGFGFYSPVNTSFGQLYLLTKVSSKSEFLKLKSEFSNQAIYSGYASDKCFAIVDGFKCNLSDTSGLNNCKTIFPIPQEAISYTEDLPSNLNSISKNYENAEIIIKECKLGNFLKIIDTKSNENDSIKKSKSGFSKGYTFVEKDMIIIYWTMNW